MNECQYDAEITLSGRAAEGTGESWAGAAAVLREREYATDAGAVRVRGDWNGPAGAPVVRVPLHVLDGRTGGDPRDLPAFVELFFHDVFLICNLAAPGSFGGTVAVSGGAYRVHELVLDARVFEAAAGVKSLPLHEVARWYDSLQIGTRQLATSGTAKALFHLLHLARGPEDDQASVIRLASAAAALGEDSLGALFALRDAIARGAAPVIHPMHDDALDASVDDDSLDWTAVVDDAAGVVIGTLQSLVSR